MLYERFSQVAGVHASKTALVTPGSEYTYHELDQRIRKLAQVMAERGVRPGDAVAVLLPNGVDFVAACFALFALDAVAVPVSTRFQGDEVRYYLDSSGSRLVLHTPVSADMLASIAPDIDKLDTTTLDWDALSERASGGGAASAPGLPAVYMYSSGSTGKPKRVTRTQTHLLAEFEALSATVALTDQDRILCTVPLYHAHGFGNAMCAALWSGATLVMTEGEFNPRDAARLLESRRISIYPAVPFMIKMLGDMFYPKPPQTPDLRLCFTAGAALEAEIAGKFERAYGVPVRQLYGSTETGAVAINYEGGPETSASVGKPLCGLTIDILDEAGAPLPAGATGEVAIRSPAMTHQYDGLPEVTAECFRDGYFLPGDLGAKDEAGNLTIKGRKKLLINVAGNKVDPLDVESLIKSHPKVADVVVVGQPHPNYGEMVKAVVVARDGGCTESEIVALCEAQLAWYKVPKVVEFRAEIPRSPLGKILRKYL